MSKRSKVHPTYKTKVRVTHWPEYDRALVRRGDLTLWFTPAALRTWTPLPKGERGGQRKYSDPCVELGLTLKLLFGLPWRSVEGLLGSLLKRLPTIRTLPTIHLKAAPQQAPARVTRRPRPP